MLADGLVKLEKFAAKTVTAAAISDVWEAAGHGFAQLLGRGDPQKDRVAERRDVNITASRGGTAVGVIHGNVEPPNPTPPGPATR